MTFDYDFQSTQVLCDASNAIRFVQWEATLSKGEFAVAIAGESRVPEHIVVNRDAVTDDEDLKALLVSASGGTLLQELDAAHAEVYQGFLVNSELVDTGVIQVTRANVDRERDRRIGAGFVYEGVLYQTRPSDRESISGVGPLALAAIIAGSQPGDLRWADPDSDFGWIAADNSVTPMDAQTALAFSQAAAAYKKHLIFAARTLKGMSVIPGDYQDDKWWI